MTKTLKREHGEIFSRQTRGMLVPRNTKIRTNMPTSDLA